MVENSYKLRVLDKLLVKAAVSNPNSCSPLPTPGLLYDSWQSDAVTGTTLPGFYRIRF